MGYIILGLIVLIIYFFLESKKNKNNLNGELRETQSDGNIRIGYYKKGIQYGECRLLDRNGNLKSVINFNDGKLDGSAIEFNFKGTIISQGSWRNNEKIGVWQSYYDDGAKNVVEHFDDNSKSISYISYYSNGIIKFERRDYFQNTYYESGVLKRRTEHKNSRRTTDQLSSFKEYYENSNLKEERQYEDTNQHYYKYYQKLFQENGLIMSEGIIEDSGHSKNRKGIWRFYDENGNINKEINQS